MSELTRRYAVMVLATEAPFDLTNPEGAFVLKPWKDPAALRALRAYADHCYPGLARDLQAWIRAIESGPVLRGDVGRRNERRMSEATPARPRATTTSRHPGGRRGKRAHPPGRKTTRRPRRRRS